MHSFNFYHVVRVALRCCVWIAVAMVAPGLTWAADPPDPTISDATPLEVQRGAVMTVKGANLTDGQAKPLITFCPAPDSECKAGEKVTPTAFTSVAPDTVKFIVPYSLALGRYTLQLKTKEEGKPAIFPGIRLAPPELKIEAVIPHVPLPEDKTDTYQITVRGSGFSSAPHLDENKLIMGDMDSLVPCASGQPDPAKCKVGARMSPGNDEITFYGIPSSYAGVHKVQFQVDGGPPSAVTNISFSRVGPWKPRWITFGVLVVLLIIVGGILYAGQRTLTTGTAVTLLKMAFIDSETNTYSLAKLQFYIWLFAGLASYIYLSIAKSLVQGIWTLSDVPDNLPMIAAISVGTGVLATGIASVAGSKGSGDLEPTWSDLITSGGVVAPERLQFLLWNLVGGAAYLLYTFAISPETIQELPTIPNTFLQIMGVSSAGYVTGKIARGPGPVIKAVTGSIDGNLRLIVQGTSLSTKGSSFFLANLPAPGTDVQVQPTILRGVNQSEIDASGMATKLMMDVPPTAGLTLERGHDYRLTIVNPDGEKSAWKFTVPAG